MPETKPTKKEEIKEIEETEEIEDLLYFKINKASDSLFYLQVTFGMEGYGTYFAIVEKAIYNKCPILLEDCIEIANDIGTRSYLVRYVIKGFNLFYLLTKDNKKYFYPKGYYEPSNFTDYEILGDKEASNFFDQW